MAWIIISVVLTLVGIILLCLISKGDRYAPEGTVANFIGHNEYGFIGWGITLFAIFGLVLIFLLASLFGINARFKKTINEYNYTKELIMSYEVGDYGNTPALMEKVIYLNDVIAEHKAKCNNPWFNLWYSENIGNLEPLTFTVKKNESSGNI